GWTLLARDERPAFEPELPKLRLQCRERHPGIDERRHDNVDRRPARPIEVRAPPPLPSLSPAPSLTPNIRPHAATPRPLAHSSRSFVRPPPEVPRLRA